MLWMALLIACNKVFVISHLGNACKQTICSAWSCLALGGPSYLTLSDKRPTSLLRAENALWCRGVHRPTGIPCEMLEGSSIHACLSHDRLVWRVVTKVKLLFSFCQFQKLGSGIEIYDLICRCQLRIRCNWSPWYIACPSLWNSFLKILVACFLESFSGTWLSH